MNKFEKSKDDRAKTYKLCVGDMFTTSTPIDAYGCVMIRKMYLHNRKWYKPWTWFKEKKYSYTYLVKEVLSEY